MSVVKSGSSGNVADVNDDKQLLVKSVSESELEFISETKQKAFSFNSTFATGGADVEVIYIKNTSSTEKMYIDYFLAGATAACVFTVFKTTDTAGGTTISGKNLNVGSGESANATAYGNAAVTGITAASTSDVVFYDGTTANNFTKLDLKGAIILNQNDAICVTCSANATVYVTIPVHYKDK